VPIRPLVTVAVVVWAVAAVVGVFLGLPMLLTVKGIDVNAGLIISGAAAVGTVGTLIWAVLNVFRIPTTSPLVPDPPIT
jgi:hypothetical protein